MLLYILKPSLHKDFKSLLLNSGQSAILLKNYSDNQVIHQFTKVSAMKRKNPDQQPENDFNLQIRFKLSSKLKESMVTATKAGKVVITIGKILTPLLLAGSIASKHLPPSNIPQFPLPPEQTKEL
jgi:hypothetical protein